MWAKFLISFGLILVLATSLSASPPASPAESSVVLSQTEYSQVLSALQEAQVQLQTSSDEIKKQSKTLALLSISCGVLLVIDFGAVGIGVYEIGRAGNWWK